MISSSQSINKPFENVEISSLLDRLREKNRSISSVFTLPVKLEPIFHSGRGFYYPDIGFTTLEEQSRFLESIKRLGIVTSSPYISIMQCSSCSSHRFCSSFVCKLCRSPNIMRGSAIAHDPCGNIDLSDRYQAEDGTLVCHKCNRNLKAIGVDYSLLDPIYHCLNCKTLLSDIGQFYKCLDCGKSSRAEDFPILLLNQYVIDIVKLSNMVNVDKSMLSVIKELEKVGIKAVHNGAVIGASRISHIFSLAAYADKVEQPFLVADIIETDGRTDEMRLLSFIGKCVDSRIENKIIVAIPNLKEDLRGLIKTNGFTLVESRSVEDIPLNLVKVIEERCNKVTESMQ